MLLASVLAAAVLATPGRAETEFLRNLHKAQTRKEKDLAERVEFLNRAIAAWTPEDGSPLLAAGLLMRGEAYYFLYNLPAAGPDLDKALELDPRSAEAYLLRGRISLRKGKPGDAVRDLSEYAALKSDDVEAWLSLAQAQLRAGDAKAAAESVRKAEQLDSTDVRVLLEQARVAMARRSWEEALEKLDDADAAAKGKSADVKIERAISRFAEGKPESALKEYDAAVPLCDRWLQEHTRGATRKIEAVEAQEKAARAYFGRGRVNEFLALAANARADYAEACRLGHAEACRKAETLAVREPEPERTAPKTQEEKSIPWERKEDEKPKKRRRTRVESDSGDRIYAN